MPQIDTCGSCAAPIFDADGVAGACACSDGIYRTLLARQQYENRRPMARQASTATDHNLAALSRQGPPAPSAIDPFMFLSPAARRELQAAQQERSMPRPQPGQGRPYAITDDPTDGFLDLRLEDAPQSDDFEFSTDDEEIDIPDRPTGNGVGGGRFRVDRPPVREPFVAARAYGPQVGRMEEVGRVGRFALLREADPPPVVREAIDRLVGQQDEIRHRGAEQRQTQLEARQLNTQQQAKRAALHDKLPTAYERVAGDFLADADDFE